MQHQPTPDYDGPVVYTVQAEWGGPVKIGYSAKASGVPSRLGALQTASPWPLVIRRITPAPMRRCDERDLHERLAKYRLAGEWFINTPVVAMATGARLPGTRDLERALRPALDAAYQAGIREGRRLHEVKTRQDILALCGLVASYFNEDELPAAEEDALSAAREELAKLVDRPFRVGPHTGPPNSSREVA